MKPVMLLVAITTVAVILSTARENPGGWQSIKNLNDERIKMVAEYAVYVHSYQNNFKLPLRLVSIRSGEVQFVDGVNYRLMVTVVPFGSPNSEGIVYRTKVHVSLDRRDARLKYFTPIYDGLNQYRSIYVKQFSSLY
ncbi:unnamed protein product [Linum trigynum]|uniref:Cystatin domain-containing protein n=1 Tax=Linum trigynum TaxID=586398 RepID=A0AAV2C8G7_9ROSI